MTTLQYYAVLWFIVYPLALTLAVFIYRVAYRGVKEAKREKERLEALERIDEQRRTTRESWRPKE